MKKVMRVSCYVPVMLFILHFQSCYAESGRVNITGSIMSNTCDVSFPDEDKTVDMGIVSVKQFLHGSTIAFPKAFSITLKNCGPLASGVSFIFKGVPDANNNKLLAIDDSEGRVTGVAIALYDRSKNNIPINTDTNRFSILPNEENIRFQFFAQYTATGAQVKPGHANAFATFEMKYE